MCSHTHRINEQMRMTSLKTRDVRLHACGVGVRWVHFVPHRRHFCFVFFLRFSLCSLVVLCFPLFFFVFLYFSLCFFVFSLFFFCFSFVFLCVFFFFLFIFFFFVFSLFFFSLCLFFVFFFVFFLCFFS